MLCKGFLEVSIVGTGAVVESKSYREKNEVNEDDERKRNVLNMKSGERKRGEDLCC